jgi:hypothetical protein
MPPLQSAEVIQVAGEFTWRVRRGEINRVVDYVAPPLLLSRESTASDLLVARHLCCAGGGRRSLQAAGRMIA